MLQIQITGEHIDTIFERVGNKSKLGCDSSCRCSSGVGNENNLIFHNLL